MVEVEFNLDPHSQHIYKKEVNVWHIQIYGFNFWEFAHRDKKRLYHPKIIVMIKFLTSHWKHEIKLTCTFEDNLTLKTKLQKARYSHCLDNLYLTTPNFTKPYNMLKLKPCWVDLNRDEANQLYSLMHKKTHQLLQCKLTLLVLKFTPMD